MFSSRFSRVVYIRLNYLVSFIKKVVVLLKLVQYPTSDITTLAGSDFSSLLLKKKKQLLSLYRIFRVLQDI